MTIFKYFILLFLLGISWWLVQAQQPSTTPPSEQKAQEVDYFIDRYQYYFANRKIDSALIFMNKAHEAIRKSKDYTRIMPMLARQMLHLGRSLGENQFDLLGYGLLVDSVQKEAQAVVAIRPELGGHLLFLDFLDVRKKWGQDTITLRLAVEKIDSFATASKDWTLYIRNYTLGLQLLQEAQPRNPMLIKTWLQKVKPIFDQQIDGKTRRLNSIYPMMEEANYYNTIGGVFTSLGDIESAEQAWLKALETVEADKYKHLNYLSVIIGSLRNVYETKSDWENAMQGALRELELLESMPTLLNVKYNRMVGCYISLAKHSEELRKYKEAIRYARLGLETLEKIKALPQKQENPNKPNPNKPKANPNNPNPNKPKANPNKPNPNKPKANPNKPNPNKPKPDAENDRLVQQLILLAAQASAYTHLNNLDTALFYIHSIEKLNPQKPKEKLILASAYADYYEQQQDWAKSVNYYQTSLSLITQIQGVNSFNNWKYMGAIARCLIPLKEYTPALIQIQRGLELTAHPLPKDKELANPIIDSILNKFATQSLLQLKLDALFAYMEADSSQKARLMPIAYETAHLIIELLDYNMQEIASQVSREDFLQKVYTVYEYAIASALWKYQQTNDTQYTKEIFDWAEKTKSIFLLQTLTESDKHKFAGIPDSLVLEEEKLRANITFYEQKANSSLDATQREGYRDNVKLAKQKLMTLYQVFKQKYPKYYDLKSQPKLATANDIQALLNDTTVFIQYFEGKKEVYAISLMNKEIRVNAYPKATYERFLRAFIKQCNTPNPLF